ncbi:MAG: response regulator [Salinivirgaceae bacterium]|jgi:signal transduction histidine kinase/ligand-binding sensor domain-containing protein/DNA-binding response OmpR family regulator|nr:response regulator [Salinivirgaceae bacterium]
MKNLTFKLILILVLLMVAQHTICKSDNLFFEKRSIQNGLSNSTVYCIYQDETGYMWFGTNDGLNRYDGYEFVTYRYNYNDPFSISGDQVTSITGDEEGNLWMGVWDGGLNFFDRKTERFYSYKNDPNDSLSISHNIVWKVYFDSGNQLWIGTLGGGLNKFIPESNNFKRFKYDPNNNKSISSNYISTIIEDKNYNLWIGTEDNGLNLFYETENLFVRYFHDSSDNNSLAGNHINSLYEDEQQRIWVGTQNEGFSILMPDDKTFINNKSKIKSSKLNCNKIRAFCQDRNNTIWIGTDGGGINILNTDNDKIYKLVNELQNQKPLSSNVVFDIYKSRDSIIWIGTFQGGIIIYDKKKNKFQPFNTVNTKGYGISHKTVMSIYEDSEGFIWFGTDGGGLNKFNPNDNTFKYYQHNPLVKSTISGNTIKSIIEDADGNLWIGTHSNGLNLLNKNTGKFERFSHDPADTNSLSHNDVWDLLITDDNNLWVATLSGGLNLLNRETMTFKHYRAKSSPNSLCCDNIFSMIEDKKKGGLWIGTRNGLSYFNIKKQYFKNYYHNKNVSGSLSNDEVNVVYQDSKGDIWIGTKHGGINLYVSEKDEFISFTIEDGLISNNIVGILEDNEHNLWISTNRGISVFNPASKLVSNYTIDDGLQSNEFLNASACKRKNGELVFGGINGFNIINPKEVKNNEYVPNVIINKLLISNKEVKIGEVNSPLKKAISLTSEISLKHFQSVITFEFTALNFTNSSKNQYAYSLEGFDPDTMGWNYIGNRRMVTFTNLNPGTYTLMVKASNNDGVWNSKPTILKITILPPYWETWWFKGAILFFIIGLLITLYLLRINQIKNQKKELEKQVYKRTHELMIANAELKERQAEIYSQKEEIEQQSEVLIEEKELVDKQNIELIKKQNEILKQNIEIKRMSDIIHRADMEKIKLFANISHEIRTPLTLILGPVERMLSLLNFDDKFHNQLQRIHNNALRLKNLINKILDFNKSENQSSISFSKYDIVVVIKNIASSFFDLAAQKNIAFNVVAKTDSLEVYFDYEKFDKIIFNLLSNAFKFTANNGSISIIVDLIIDKTDLPNEYVGVKISDSGIGIPSADLERIFERFYQSKHPQNNSIEGTGIGLSIAKNFTELHYGRIFAESEERKGSCFTVLLPLGNSHLKDSQIFPAIEKSENNNETASIIKKSIKTKEETQNREKLCKVLLVEDNNDLRDYIKESLIDYYQVTEANNGAEGLEKAKKDQPDIIISDIMMPKTDGIELCKIIKNSIETSHIPVILLTAKSTLDDKIKGLETGADDYISKPFSDKELHVRIKNLLNSRLILKEKFSKDIVLEPQDITLSSEDERFLQKAFELVEENMSDLYFDVSKFVSEMAVSRSLLHLKLKKLTNQSAGDFIRMLRLKRAAQLLKQNKVTVSEVSYMVGIDPKNFSKCFKKQFGVSPGQYADVNADKN